MERLQHVQRTIIRIRRRKAVIDIMDWLTGWDSKASFEEELISLVLKCGQRTPCFALQDFSRAEMATAGASKFP